MLAFSTLLAFVVLMVGTPGPANLILMLAGVRQGLRQSVGFILGLIVGKIALNLFIGFGFGLVLAKAPFWQMLFSYVSASYMIWLALKSWPTSDADISNAEYAQDHFRFRDGLFVHPINSKAWVMCVLAWGQFAPDLGDFSVQLPVVILTFAICQLCLHSLWCWLGTIMGKSLRNNVRLTRAMIVSTVIIVLTATLL
ncbi:LysE family translocator [Candidatus Puniceispirillum sp.]|nr:LysE family translocator [Candidatus Puniceispirillum sp.]